MKSARPADRQVQPTSRRVPTQVPPDAVSVHLPRRGRKGPDEFIAEVRTWRSRRPRARWISPNHRAVQQQPKGRVTHPAARLRVAAHDLTKPRQIRSLRGLASHPARFARPSALQRTRGTCPSRRAACRLARWRLPSSKSLFCARERAPRTHAVAGVCLPCSVLESPTACVVRTHDDLKS